MNKPSGVEINCDTDSPNTYIPIIWLDRQRTTEYSDTRIYD